MNQKIERTIAEIDKVKDKITVYQAKLRELEQRKTSLENEEIVAMFRKEKLTETEFAAFIKSTRTKEAAREGDDNEN